MQSSRYSALRISLIYALVAAAWILLSDLVVARFEDDGLQTLVSVAKGWGFVLVTAILLYVLVKRDINRIWNTEAQMRLLFNSLSDGIYVMSMGDDGRIDRVLDVNEAASRRLGYTREELLKTSPIDLVAAHAREEAAENTANILRDGGGLLETVLVTREGQEFPAEISAKSVSVNGKRLLMTIVRDITERNRAEEERRESALAAERDKRRFYRETILALTEGKFELGDTADRSQWFCGRGFRTVLTGPQNLADVRHRVMEYCRKQGLSEESARDFELAIGEALGNAVKHAGKASVCAGTRGNEMWVAVVDKGPGIDTFALPKVALMAGFTTKASMGLGYTVILELCDHVRLVTGPAGTTVVMEKHLKPVTEVERLLAMHKAVE